MAGLFFFLGLSPVLLQVFLEGGGHRRHARERSLYVHGKPGVFHGLHGGGPERTDLHLRILLREVGEVLDQRVYAEAGLKKSRMS